MSATTTSAPTRSSRATSHARSTPHHHSAHHATRHHATNPTMQSTIVLDHTAMPRSNNLASTMQIAATAAGQVNGVVKKRPEPLFGPDVGGPVPEDRGWLAGVSTEDKRVVSPSVAEADSMSKVSLDTVRHWVERAKSEESLHPTTTLQALVNLKRPTLQLTPVVTETEQSEGSEATGYAVPDQRHILSFLYDALTPLVRVTLSLHPHPSLPQKPIVLYQGQHEGGFGKVFRLPEEYALDLAAAVERARAASLDDGSTDDGKDHKEAAAHANSQAGAEAHIPTVAAANNAPRDATAAQAAPQAQPSPATTNSHRRFPFFGGRSHRRREADIEAQILAEASGNTFLADQRANGEAIELQDTSGSPNENLQEEQKADEEGMRVLITLDALTALDADTAPSGQTLPNPNSQLTHILIMGMTASTVPAEGDSEPAEGGSSPEANQRRVWVIKVVRREAVIGSHCFLLKEIYGLASSSASDPPAPGNNNVTYPPTAAPSDDPYASTPNECIVCLTSPRDVVLLPCRHLVVCRECAVGMIEFGAGGKVARREDVVEANNGDATGAAAGVDGAQATTPNIPAPVPPPTRERRKRKAKGWFCPVCRQPYTSLLRLALPSSTDASSIHDHVLSRAPSLAGGASLRRVSSRATLPERGERMLESITPHGNGQEDADGEEETETERREREQQEEMDREDLARPQFVLEDEVTPVVHRTPTVEDSAASRTSPLTEGHNK